MGYVPLSEICALTDEKASKRIMIFFMGVFLQIKKIMSSEAKI
jgi:hypothetical protein